MSTNENNAGDRSARVGILTFHDTTNFGACLQTVATYKILKEQNCPCEIIDYHCAEIDRREIIPGNFKEHSIIYPIRLYLKHRKHLKKHVELLRFLKAETQISECQYRSESILEADKRYDRFLVGSDMLWCTQFTSHDYTFMLDFVGDDKKKYCFATSVGYDWEKEEENIIKQFIQRFQIIAVREEDMAVKLEGMIGKKVETVCDPTMLISPDIWREYAKRSKMRNLGPYCLVYVDVPSGQCLKDAKEFVKDKHVNVFWVGFKKAGKQYNGYRVMEVYGVEDFLAAIAEAEMVFTSSYHGMLFAIYFHTPFVYYNKDFSRLESIAKRFGLEDRNGDVDWTCAAKAIDWNKVDKLRENFRIHSERVLRKIVTYLTMV